MEDRKQASDGTPTTSASAVGNASADLSADPNSVRTGLDEPTRETEKAGFFKCYAALWPLAAGLACAYMGLQVATEGSLRYTDQGVFTDGAAAVALIPCLIAAAILYKTRFVFEWKHMAVIVRIAAGVETVVLLVAGILRLAGLCTFPVRFGLSVLATIASAICIACWLRRGHDDGRPLQMGTAAVMVFSALFLSQIPVFAVSLLPDGVRCLVITPFVAAQFVCLAWARRRRCAADVDEHRADDYFAFMRSGEANRRFLMVCAMGIAALSLVAGFLSGFPKGDPIPFPLCARAVCFVLTEAMCAAFIASTLRRQSRTMTVRVWIVMQLLPAIALLLYCAFPDKLEIGAIACAMLGTLMTAFVWHLITAFVASGWRDPFYYAAVVWSIWIAARAVGRFVLLGVMPTGGDSHFTGTVISLLLLVSTQLILVRLIDVSRFAAERAALADREGASLTPAPGSEEAEAEENGASQAEPAKPGALERILGLDGDSTLADARHAVVRHNAELMGAQFLLSEREIEVLALYVSGHTQKRVAEELHISQTTAHTHISRIYAKTGLHSRQELLDYLRQYGDM